MKNKKAKKYIIEEKYEEGYDSKIQSKNYTEKMKIINLETNSCEDFSLKKLNPYLSNKK